MASRLTITVVRGTGRVYENLKVAGTAYASIN